MSARPTPETDALALTVGGVARLMEDYDSLCRKLERNRDESVELLRDLCIAKRPLDWAPDDLVIPFSRARAFLDRLEKEKTA